MSNIQTYLKQILDAVYGEEVRGSIHDAIATMNSDLEAAIRDDLNPLAFKGNLGESGGTNNNLNNLTQTDQRGIWRLKGSTTYTNVPSGFDNTKQAYLIMYAFGESGQSATVAKQEIHYFSDSGANANAGWSRVYISGEWQEWHRNVDDTLSLEGAAADSKAVGDEIYKSNNSFGKMIGSIDALCDADFSLFDRGIASGIWRNNKVYPPGYIKSVSGKIVDESSQNVILVFIDPETKVVIRSWTFNGKTGNFDLPINIVMQKEFGIGIYCQKLAYRNNANMTVYRTAISSASVGTDVTGTDTGNYELAIKVNYDSITNQIGKYVSEGVMSSVIYSQNNLDNYVNSILSGWWWNDYAYEPGYIDSITLKAPTGNAGSKLGVMIIDSTNNQVLFRSDNNIAGSSLLVDVPVHLYTDNPVYIACINSAYVSFGEVRNYVRATNIDPTVGETLSYSWSGTANYKFAIKVNYTSMSKTDLKYCKVRKRMFISGDSITAGYPFNINPIIPNLRYGDAISRMLDFDVTFGAQSGNGWLYTSGSAYAYSITNETDFSLYDVALYAWGTNDFFHDMTLGTINDTYSDQTVCGTINYCINKIYTDNPSIVFIISTPLNRVYNNGFGYTTPNNKGYTLLEMSNRIIDLCKKAGVPYIDNICSPFNAKSLSGLTGDGLHPNKVGYQVLGSYMASKVGSIIKPYETFVKGK